MVRTIVALLLLLAPVVSARGQSRYLSEGAATAVKWEAWGSRAIERAKREQRPLFVSVGFASSFECFLMQRETYTNAEVAQSLNLDFVPVLLDRIEHPEVAESLELVARSINDTSGWPVHVVLTPDLEPFAAAGSLPAPELRRFLVLQANRWGVERNAVLAEARQNLAKAKSLGERRAPAPVDPSVLGLVLDDVAKAYDGATTPQPMALSLALRNDKARGVVIDKLRKLALLPIRDQLGGGFHRATREAAWKQPYFEKMLTDQALLSIAYLEAWQITRDPELERIARSTLDAALRDLHPRNGAFDASQDAHSLVPAKGPEFWNGAFYLWTKDEVTHLLGHENAAKVIRLWDMKDVVRNLPTIEDARQLTDPALPPLLEKLLDVRQKRPQPFRESNVISGLNGLMISALARAGASLGEKTYVDAATFATQIVVKSRWNAKERALQRGQGVPALAEDYAMLIQGLLDLFQATYDVRWLDLAMALQQRQDQLFWDDSAGRYTTGASVPEALRGLLNERDLETPAVNSVAAMNLLRLATLTGNEAWSVRPSMIFQSFGARLRNDGAQLPQLASAYATSLATAKIAVVTGDPRKKATFDLLHTIHQRWEPLRIVLFVPHKGPLRDRIVKALPFTGALAVDPENPVEYECSNGECRRR